MAYSDDSEVLMRSRIVFAVIVALWLGVMPTAADEPVDAEVN